ncbi:MAG: hypothetical protein PF590_09235 [Candidatus Delongbacteria bacterium]|jgi:hypothetical protein|nr:hypothetical protein [Candidatus Delongbacteria bacterium]
MKKLHFTKEQITKILSEVATKENGFEEVLKLSLYGMCCTSLIISKKSPAQKVISWWHF